MKIKVGNTYRAHVFDCGERILSKGFYHFKILCEESFFNNKTMAKESIYLGLKLGIRHSPYETDSQCFWFDKDGINDDSSGIVFKLVRKIR